MTEGQIAALIHREVRQAIAQLTMGKIVSTEDKMRATTRRFNDDSPIENHRIIHPYGFASRPPEEMDAVLAPIAGDPTNINVLGQFDPNRPQIEAGESVLYGPDGQVVYMKTGGEIHLGSLTSDQQAVLGNVLSEFLGKFLDDFLNAPQIGECAVGSVFLDPTVRTQMVAQKEQYLTDASTNILAQKIFVERGA